MIALFLGELFRFSVWRRVVLLGVALCIAFGCNVVRSLVLVYLFADYGRGTLARYHDNIGLGVLGFSLALVGALAYLLKLRQGRSKDSGAGTVSQGRAIPTGALLLVLGWLAFVEAATEVWYRMHDPGRTAVSWSVNFPVTEREYHGLQIPEVTEAILRCNQEQAAEWVDESGNHWSMFFLRWYPGRASVQLARSHGPEICLPAAGLTQLADTGVYPWRVGDITLDAHTYTFGAPGRIFYVFYCLAEDREPGAGLASTRQRMTTGSRLEAVWAGRRNRGQQVLEMVVAGPPDAEAGREAMARTLSKIVCPASVAAGG